MSDWDGSDYDHDAGTGTEHDSLQHAEQANDLNQLHQEYGDQHDSLDTNQQYGHVAGYENDQDFNNGHHVEYDGPNGMHFEQTDFTQAEARENGFEADFGQSEMHASHDEAYGELDSLQERMAADFTSLEHDSTGDPSIAGK
jgi:hypothetical protein